MSQVFQALVARLWERLDLPPPRFTEPNRIRLQVERVGVNLADTGLGRMTVEASAGRLGPDGPARIRDVRRVLETNLGLLVGNEAGVYVARTASGNESLMVHGSHALRGGNLDRLVKTIEDVVRVAEFYAGELKAGGTVAPEPRRTQAPSRADQMMIFRP